MTFRVGDNNHLNNLYNEIISPSQSANRAGDKPGRAAPSLSTILEFLGRTSTGTKHLLKYVEQFDSNLLVSLRNDLTRTARDIADNIRLVTTQIRLLSNFDIGQIGGNQNQAFYNAENYNLENQQITDSYDAITAYNVDGDPTIDIDPPGEPPLQPLPEIDISVLETIEDPDEAADAYNAQIDAYNAVVAENNAIKEEWNAAIEEYNTLAAPAEPLETLEATPSLTTIEPYDVNPQAASRNNTYYANYTSEVDALDALVNGTDDTDSLEDRVDAYNASAEEYNTQLDDTINPDRAAENPPLDPLPYLELIETPLPEVSLDVADPIDYPTEPNVDDLNDLNANIGSVNNSINTLNDDKAAINTIVNQLNTGVNHLQAFEGEPFYPAVPDVATLQTASVLNRPLETMEYFYDFDSSLSVAEITERVDDPGIAELNDTINDYNTLTDPNNPTGEAITNYVDNYDIFETVVNELSGTTGFTVDDLPEPINLPTGGSVIEYETHLWNQMNLINDHITDDLGSPPEIALIDLQNGIQDFSIRDMERTIDKYLGPTGRFVSGGFSEPVIDDFTLMPLEALDTVDAIYQDYLLDTADDLNEFINDNPDLPPTITPITDPSSLSTEELETAIEDLSVAFSEVDEDLQPTIEPFSLSEITRRLELNQGQIDYINSNFQGYNDFAAQMNNIPPEVWADPRIQAIMSPPNLVPFTGSLHSAPQIHADPITFSDTEAGSNILAAYGFDPFKAYADALRSSIYEDNEEEPIDVQLKKQAFGSSVILLDSPGAAGLLLQAADIQPVSVSLLLSQGLNNGILLKALQSVSVPGESTSSTNYRSFLDGSDGISGPEVNSFLEKLKDLLSGFTISLNEKIGSLNLGNDLNTIFSIFGDASLDNPALGSFFALSDLEGALASVESGFISTQIANQLKTSPIFDQFETATIEAVATALSPIAETQVVDLAINEVVSVLEDPTLYYQVLRDIGNAVERGEVLADAIKREEQKLRDAFSLAYEEKLPQLTPEQREEHVDRTLSLLIGPSIINPDFTRGDADDGNLFDKARQKVLHALIPNKEEANSPSSKTALSAVETLISLHQSLENKIEQTTIDDRTEKWENFLDGSLIAPNVDSALFLQQWLTPNHAIQRRGARGGTSADSADDMATISRLNWSG